MSLRTWLQRVLTTSSQVGWNIVRGSNPDDFQRTGTTVRLQGWERNPVVSACVRAIVDIVAAVDLEVYRKKADGSAEVIQDHEAAHLLNYEPRLGLTGHGLRAQTGVHYLLYGNGLWGLERGGRRGRPTGVRVIHPQHLSQVRVNAAGIVQEFDWTDWQGKTYTSSAADILHFKDLTASDDGLFGFPRAASALQDIAADYEATQYVRQVVTNHGVPGLAVKTKGYKQQSDLTAAEEKFNDKMKARGGRGGAWFINADEVEFEQLGFNLQQLEFPDLRSIAREDICAAFGVDPRIVGVASATGKESSMSGEQYREARFKLIQHAVMPVLKAWESELDRWYMPEWGDVYIRFSPDTLSEMTEDETLTSTRVIAEVGARIRTIEEARETVGLSADLDPAHHFGGPQIQVVKIALEEGEKTPAEQAKELADAQPKPEKPVARITPADSMTRGLSLTGEQRTQLWREFDTRATREEATFLRVLRVLFGYEQSRLADLFRVNESLTETTTNALMRQVAELYAPGGELYERWVTDTASAFRRLVDFDLPNPRVLNALRRRSITLTDEVTGTTVEQVRGFLILGREHGQTVSQVAGMIGTLPFTPERARMIARTETIGALNEAAYQQAREAGVMRSKSWLSQRDDEVRDTHTHAESQGWIPIEKAFANGLQFPGDQNGGAEEVINCRCTVLYSDEEQP